MLTRLNKLIAAAGICSRREADRLIEEGQVRVNGLVVQELGTKVDDRRDRVTVKDRAVRPPDERFIYILLHKPKGVVTSVRDPLGRKTVMDCIRGVKTRVYPVGRLDSDSSGALLLTNDGDLAHKLMHPRFGVAKIYEVEVEGRPKDEDIARLSRGVFLEGRRTAPAGIKAVFRSRNRSVFRVEMREGRKREVRKMFETVGCPVIKLVRVEFGGLGLNGLIPGAWRALNDKEAAGLRKQVSGERSAGPRPQAGPVPRGRSGPRRPGSPA